MIIIKNGALCLIIFISSGLVAFGGEEEKNPRIDFSVKLEKIDSKYFFVLNGQTNLPESTRLNLEIDYLSYAPRGDKKDEFDEFENSLEVSEVWVTKGSFKINLGGYKRKPFSRTYRTSVTFDPQIQIDRVANDVKHLPKMTKKFDLTLGTREEFEKEIDEVKNNIKNDFEMMSKIWDEVRSKSEILLAGKVEKNAWEKFEKDWRRRYEDIELRNDARIGKWLVRVETLGKIYLEGLLKRMKNILEKCSKLLEKEQTEISKREKEDIHLMMNNFQLTFNEDLKNLDLDMPFNKAKSSTIFASLRMLLERIRDIVSKENKAEWAKNNNTLEKEMLDLIFEITENIPSSSQADIPFLANKFYETYSLCDKFLAGDKNIKKDNVLEEIENAIKVLEELREKLK